MTADAIAQAVAAFHAGDDDKTLLLLTPVLQSDANNPYALHLFALILLSRGRLEQSAQFLQKGLVCHPEAWFLHEALAKVAQMAGQTYMPPAINRATGKWDNRQIADLSKRSESLEALVSRAETLATQGDYAQAEQLFLSAVQLAPDNSNVWMAAARHFLASGKMQESLEAFERAIALNTDKAAATAHAGNCYLGKYHFEQAIPFFGKALSLVPGDAGYTAKLAQCYLGMNDVAQARTLMQRVIVHSQGDPIIRLEYESFMPLIFESTEAIGLWRNGFARQLSNIQAIDVDHRVDALSSAHIHTMSLTYHGQDNRALKERMAALFVPPATGLPAGKGGVALYVDGSRSGIFLKFMAGILLHWNAQDIPLTIITQEAGKQPLSQVAGPLVNIMVVPDNLQEMVELIRVKHFSCLYFWEVGTTTANYLLPFFRLAPMQCTSWGSVETSGLPCVDYFISWKPIEPSDAQAQYTEKLVTFEHMPSCYFRPAIAEGHEKERKDLGLPLDVPLYICPQHIWKVHPEFDVVLENILKHDPNGIIAMIAWQAAPTQQAFEQRLFARPLLKERLRFIPYQNQAGYYSLLNMADVMLDTMHCGGGQTSLEALAFGTPVVTFPGAFMRTRITYGLYQSMGINDPVAKDWDDYVTKAVRIANDREYATALRQKISAANAVLFDNTATVQEYAAFFRRFS